MIKSRRILVSLFILGTVLTVFFGWRAYQHYQYLERAETAGFQVESLRGWMTLDYIAERYHVPLADIFIAIGVPQQGNERQSLHQLIDKYQLNAVDTRLAIETLIVRQSVPADR